MSFFNNPYLDKFELNHQSGINTLDMINNSELNDSNVNERIPVAPRN